MKRWFVVMLLWLTGCASTSWAATETPPFATTGVAARPSLSLSGRLLFVKQGDLWLWQADSATQLTNQGNLTHPAWSPDGSRIVAVERDLSVSNLVVMNADGTAIRPLTRNGPSSGDSFTRAYRSVWAFYPAWTFDGSAIWHVSQASPPVGDPAIEYRLSLFSSTLSGQHQQLYALNEGHMGKIALLDDGAIVTMMPERAPMRLLRYREGVGATELEDVPPESYDPAVSPDQRWLAFAQRSETGTDLYLYDLQQGGSPVRLTRLGVARAPAWSPDGRQLVFLAAHQERRFDLWTIDLQLDSNSVQAAQPIQLTQGAAIDAEAGLSWIK